MGFSRHLNHWTDVNPHSDPENSQEIRKITPPQNLRISVSRHIHLHCYLYCKRSDQSMATVHIYRNRQGMKGPPTPSWLYRELPGEPGQFHLWPGIGQCS